MLLVPVVAVTVLGVGGQKSWWNNSVLTATAELKQRPAKSGLCGGFQGPMSTRDLSQCTWGADRPGRPIYLMGDSNAGQFTEALIDASDRLDRPLVVATRGGCPLVDARVRTVGTQGVAAKGCQAWFDDAVVWLQHQEAGTVVVASAGEVVTDDSLEVQRSEHVWSAHAAEKERLWREGAATGTEAVEAAGHKTIVVAPVPHLPGEGRPWWHPAECANAPWFRNTPESCDRSISVDEYRTSQRADREAAKESADAVGGEFLDPQDELCRAGRCSAFREGHWWYRDGLHISPYGSHQLSAAFVRTLKAADVP